MAYTIRYTISSLTGAYALKYSVSIHDAGRIEGLLALAKAPEFMTGFASGGEVRRYDAFSAFNALMKVLKYVMKSPERTFCTAIECEAGGEKTRGVSFEDEDETGQFVVRAYGKKGELIRGETSEAFDEVKGKKGTYRAVTEPMRDVFKTDLENLLNLCEETIAKDAMIIATEVSNDAPEAAPLFQLKAEKR